MCQRRISQARSCPRPRFLVLLSLVCLGVSPSVMAATSSVQSAWFGWFNSARLGDTWGLVSDIQYRHPDDRDTARNLLIRGGLSWHAARQHTFSAGYAYIGTYADALPDATEHRSWQQWVPVSTLGDISIAQRFRLEQRFVGRPTAPDFYSDRLRWFTRTILPLRSSPPFERGAFLALQNEVMFNLTGRDDLNGAILDQNRAYIASGWRLSPRTDVEFGYLNQWVKGRQGDTINHVLQFAIYSR